MSTADIQISNAPAGYLHGMRQASAEMTVTLTQPEQFDAKAADAALHRLFKLTDGDMTPPQFLEGCTPDEVTGAILRAICILARHFMVEGGVPAYAPEVVTHIAHPTATSPLKITMRVPVVMQVPRHHAFDAYANAVRFVWIFTVAPNVRGDEKATADVISDKLIVPMRRAMRRGASTRPITLEAFNRGIPFTYLTAGVFQIGYGTASRLTSMSGTDKDSQIGAKIAHHKDQTQTVLSSIGAPTAQMIMVKDAHAAAKAAQVLGYPVVLKPADLDRSEGVFVDLATPTAVRRAYAAARKLSANIMVQRRIPGHCHRLVTFQGRFVFGFTRHPAGIVGNGTSSLQDLVSAFNTANVESAKHIQSKPLPFDDLARACLARQVIHPDDILKKDQVAYLRDINLLDFAAHNEIITDRVHPENIRLIERLAGVFRLESCGFDLISPDPGRPWYENGAAITELNFHPQIGKHTAKANIAALYPTVETAMIPVTCFIGGDAAMSAGQEALAALHKAGTTAALVSHDTALHADGSKMHLSGQAGLLTHTLATLRDPAIAALIVVLQSDHWVRTGPPLTGLIKVVVVDNDLHSIDDPRRKLPTDVAQDLARVMTEAALTPS